MRIGLALAVPFFIGFGGFMFVFPVAVQQGEQFGAFHAGLVLADVPTEQAGIGSDVLNTTMQMSLALGVAVLGSVFFAALPALGMRDAFAVALGCELVALLVGAALAPRLPGGLY